MKKLLLTLSVLFCISQAFARVEFWVCVEPDGLRFQDVMCVKEKGPWGTQEAPLIVCRNLSYDEKYNPADEVVSITTATTESGSEVVITKKETRPQYYFDLSQLSQVNADSLLDDGILYLSTTGVSQCLRKY